MRGVVVLPALRPSEYTAALIQTLRNNAAHIRGAHALEIGSGSGVVLAAIAALGAASMCGIDVEADAIASGTQLLHNLGHGSAAEFHRGDMWSPVAGRRFNLIAANLPHFPMERSDLPGRLPTWSAGGSDGRRLLDAFLEGLADHLAPGGRAFITHNGFVGLPRSQEIAVHHGLSLRAVTTTLIFIPAEKLDRMTASVLHREQALSIFCYGPYAFADMHIVEICKPDAMV